MRRIAAISLTVILLLTAGCDWLREEPVCSVCQRPLLSNTFYRVMLENGEHQDFCCPRCGLHFQKDSSSVVTAEVADYSSTEFVEASRAYYVENSSVMLCCSMEGVKRDASGTQYERSWDRCMPSLVGFRNLESAEAFRAEHGGIIKTFDELLGEN